MSIDVLQEKICKLKNPTVAGLDPEAGVYSATYSECVL